MDGGLTVRPTSVVTQVASVRQDATPVPDAVSTNLAPSQAVTAAAKTNEVRQDALQSASADPSYVRKIVLDAHSREVICQVVDVHSRRVVRQIPEEAILRLRAYNRALASGATPNQAHARADVEA